MKQTTEAEAPTEYVLQERRLHGTPDEILAQLDELIQSLVAVRQMLTVEQLAKKQRTSTRRLRLVRTLGVLVLVLGLANVSYLTPAGNGLTVKGGIFGSLIGYDGL